MALLAFMDKDADIDRRIDGAMLVHSYLADIAWIRRVFFERNID